MKAKIPLISIVILAGPKRKKELICCLNSIKKSSYKNYEVIVVDNSQNPKLALAVKNKFPQTKLIIMPENTGVLGFNIGFANAKGKYILALDDDCTINSDTLLKIAEIFPKKPEKVMVLSANFYNPINKFFYSQKLLKQNSFATLTFYGGGVVFKKSLFDKIGYYDSSFFFWYHELDLGLRILNAGFKIHFEPKIIVNHHEKNNYLRKSKIFLSYRNQFWFNIKNFSLAIIPLLVSRDLFFIIYLFIKTKSFKNFFYAFSGYLTGLFTIFIPLKKKNKISYKNQLKFLKHCIY